MVQWFDSEEDALLESLAAAYRLEWVEWNVEQYVDSAFPDWWLGRSLGARIGVRNFGSEWLLVIGRVPDLLDVELTRLERPGLMPESSLSVDDFVPPGHRLAEQFCITRQGAEDERFAGAQLSWPVVADELARMSPAIRQIGVHRSGLELFLDRNRLSREGFDRDLVRAVEVTGKLIEFARLNPTVETPAPVA